MTIKSATIELYIPCSSSKVYAAVIACDLTLQPFLHATQLISTKMKVEMLDVLIK
jgi:hypothetical protein